MTPEDKEREIEEQLDAFDRFRERIEAEDAADAREAKHTVVMWVGAALIAVLFGWRFESWKLGAALGGAFMAGCLVSRIWRWPV